MMPVFESMIGVPVIPINVGTSPQLESAALKGGWRVRSLINLPVLLSKTRTMFFSDDVMTSSEPPSGV